MLTRNEQEKVEAKLAELHLMLKGMGVDGTEIRVLACSDAGIKELDLTYSAGYWRSSSQACNPEWGASSVYLEASPTWQPSGLNC